MLEFGQASLHFRCFFPNHYDGTIDPVPPQVFSSLLMPWARGSKWFAAIGVFWPLGNRDVRVGATWLMDAYGACISLNICPHVSPTISVWHWTTLHARYADATSANICKPSQHSLAFVCVRGATHMCFKVSKKGFRVDKNEPWWDLDHQLCKVRHMVEHSLHLLLRERSKEFGKPSASRSFGWSDTDSLVQFDTNLT